MKSTTNARNIDNKFWFVPVFQPKNGKNYFFQCINKTKTNFFLIQSDSWNNMYYPVKYNTSIRRRKKVSTTSTFENLGEVRIET